MFNKLSTHFNHLTAKIRGLNDRCWCIIDLMESAPEVREQWEGGGFVDGAW